MKSVEILQKQIRDGAKDYAVCHCHHPCTYDEEKEFNLPACRAKLADQIGALMKKEEPVATCGGVEKTCETCHHYEASEVGFWICANPATGINYIHLSPVDGCEEWTISNEAVPS